MIPKRINVTSESVKSYTHLNNHKSSYNVNAKQYRDISKDFFEELAYLLITTGDVIVFPTTLGAIQAVKYRTSHPEKGPMMVVDYNKTKKAGKTIYHNSLSTNGYWCRVHWYRIPRKNRKYGARFKNSYNYRFALTRPNLRYNTYNKWNPRVRLYEFFKDKGWEIYQEKQSTQYERIKL